MSKTQAHSYGAGAAEALAAAIRYLDREGFFSWWRPTRDTTLDGLREHGFDALDQLEFSGELAIALGRPVPEWREGAETLGEFVARV